MIKTEAGSNQTEKSSISSLKTFCVPLFTYTSDIFSGRLGVESMSLVVKRKEGGEEGGWCGAEIVDTPWRASQVPRAALHLNGRQKTKPAVHSGFEGLWFAAGAELWCLFLCGRKQKTPSESAYR